MGISIFPFALAELEATDEVVKAAYNVLQSRKETLQRYLTLQPAASFVAKDDGVVVGFGSAMDYGSFAYIGLMSVHPAVQKRGVGGLLLEALLAWLDGRGCSSVLLDATPVGARLYERYGFVEDDKTVVLRQTEIVPLSRALSESVSLVVEAELPELVAFDAPWFGAERGGILASYWADNPEQAFVVRDVHEQISGYLMAQPHALGPWVVGTVEDAERLLVRALTLSFESEPGVFVSVNNREALRLLKHYGFGEQRVLSHMRKGKGVQRSRHKMLYGQASLGFG